MISSNGEYMLIDTGADSNAVVDYVERNGINQLEYLIITSFESCHTGGLRYLVSSGIEIGTVIIPDIPQRYISPSVKRAISSLEAICDIVRIGVGDTDYRFNFGDGKFTLFAPIKLSAEDHIASYSIITSVEISDKRILLMSDATAENLTAMVENSTLPKADIITVASHGRYDVWSDDILSGISPYIAVITPITFIDTEVEVDAVTKKLESSGIDVISVMDDVIELNVIDGTLTIK